MYLVFESLILPFTSIEEIKKEEGKFTIYMKSGKVYSYKGDELPIKYGQVQALENEVKDLANKLESITKHTDAILERTNALVRVVESTVQSIAKETGSLHSKLDRELSTSVPRMTETVKDIQRGLERVNRFLQE